MSNNIWKLADVLEAQAVADLIDVVSIEELKDNAFNVPVTILIQILLRSTDKTFVRLMNVAPENYLTGFWADSKVRERAQNFAFKEMVVKSELTKEELEAKEMPYDNYHKQEKKLGKGNLVDVVQRSLGEVVNKVKAKAQAKKNAR